MESAFLVSAVLAPLMLGVLYYGTYFWRLQSVPLLDPVMDQSALVGAFCEADLVERVEQETLEALGGVDEGSGLPVSAGAVTAEVVGHRPGHLGVDVEVTVRVQVMSEPTLVPLPGDGRVTHSTSVRLENVTISAVCS